MQKFALKVSMCGVCTTISLLLQLQNMVHFYFEPVYDTFIYIQSYLQIKLFFIVYFEVYFLLLDYKEKSMKKSPEKFKTYLKGRKLT